MAAPITDARLDRYISSLIDKSREETEERFNLWNVTLHEEREQFLKKCLNLYRQAKTIKESYSNIEECLCSKEYEKVWKEYLHYYFYARLIDLVGNDKSIKDYLESTQESIFINQSSRSEDEHEPPEYHPSIVALFFIIQKWREHIETDNKQSRGIQKKNFYYLVQKRVLDKSSFEELVSLKCYIESFTVQPKSWVRLQSKFTQALKNWSDNEDNVKLRHIFQPKKKLAGCFPSHFF